MGGTEGGGGWNPDPLVENHKLLYPTKKKHTTTIFSFRCFKNENVSCHEIFISDQIILKLESDVDEYVSAPSLCRHTTHQGE